MLKLFSIDLKLFWLMINCLKRLDLRATNMVSLYIQKDIECEIENVFEKRFD